MSSLLKTRKSKAATLVPLALLCAAWTSSLVGVNAASADRSDAAELPDGSAVPSLAIMAPASVPIPGAIAPGVPDGSADAVVAGASTSGVPSAALSAYQRASQIINAADPGCNTPWELLAAIGRVESNHGQYGGNVLGSDGVSQPGIFGPQLNGQNGTQAISDTDGGQLDKDTVYDRAVGPMQFIPSTWSSVKVDADGDGQRNPQDIDDASLASGVYLCSGTDDLSTRAGQEAAVFRYNHSRAYVDLVLRIMEAYSQGEYSAIPSGTYGGTVFTPSYSSAVPNRDVTPPKNDSSPAQPSKPSGGSQTPTAPSGEPETPTSPTSPTTPLDGVTDVVNGVTQPVVDTLSTLTEALGFCNEQFAAIPDPLGLLAPLKTQCANEVKGMTESDAAALIPNTLTTILSWLGL